MEQSQALVRIYQNSFLSNEICDINCKNWKFHSGIAKFNHEQVSFDPIFEKAGTK